MDTQRGVRLLLSTAFCLVLFASNSLVCRVALVQYGMQAWGYTALRTLAAAAVLTVLCLSGIIGAGTGRQGREECLALWRQGSWGAAALLFAYMLFFSLAYVDIPAATGTLVLNTAVQVVMVGWGVLHGARLDGGQFVGFALAAGGLVLLVAAKFETPSLTHALLMGISGACWGGYTLCGRNAAQAMSVTTGNFLRCIPLGLTALLYALLWEQTPALPAVACALAAGGFASGLGYALWYHLLPRYDLMSSSIIQLSIPVVTAVLAVPVLAEPVTLRLLLCGVCILGGIALVLNAGQRRL